MLFKCGQFLPSDYKCFLFKYFDQFFVVVILIKSITVGHCALSRRMPRKQVDQKIFLKELKTKTQQSKFNL